MNGDVLKTLGVNGSSITIRDGFVTTTTGRMTAILYSLFASDWVGNLFVTGEQVLTSSFQELHNTTATLDALLNIASSAQDSLNWLVRTGKIKSVVASTRIFDGGTYLTEIDFTELDETVTRIEVWKFPNYWEVRGVS
jgi:hypothetical protein